MGCQAKVAEAGMEGAERIARTDGKGQQGEGQDQMRSGVRSSGDAVGGDACGGMRKAMRDARIMRLRSG